MALSLTVHRGTQQIGGSCIEIAGPLGERLILDAGRPLDASREIKGLLPATLDVESPATALISHPHMDHWGLIGELPVEWPIWTGEKSAEMIRLTGELFDEPVGRTLLPWPADGSSFEIGQFTVTPYLTDHSAFDAYMLLIEGYGRRILYTGDFRAHGRKAKLVEDMIAAPPHNIDILLMEGTNLRTDKPTITERQLEDRLVSLADEVEGHVFVEWSAQNLDRTTTLYRAARRAGRKLIVDLYTADVLLRIAPGSGVPRPDPLVFSTLLVMITGRLARLYERRGRGDLVSKIIASGRATSRAKAAENGRAIIMTRKSLLREFESNDLLPITARDAYVHSNWRGYLDESDKESGWVKAGLVGARRELIHTSGHASPADLVRFAKAIAPRKLVPVHGVTWDDPGIELPPVLRLADGEKWLID